ncbi:gb [Venturia nashicola]|uniref:Gb n=1 Tax=Venturia nashicola TaxID=86259 RepID=A0A4Z1P4L9_9PEZI|nr:gb [Venturia nashicola]TLD36425.1 gb [Venturia nashicola]
MSLWNWYNALPPKTRLVAGIGVMAYAAGALYLSDKAEETFGLKATEEDREKLRKAIPRITTVERDNDR